MSHTDKVNEKEQIEEQDRRRPAREEQAALEGEPEAPEVNGVEAGGEARDERGEQAAPERSPDGSPGEPAMRLEELESLRAEHSELNERLLRQAAEFQNFRRRTEEEKARIITSSKARVLRPLLEVVDDVERTLEAAEQFDEHEEATAAYRSLKEGVELVSQKLKGELARLGVEPIEAVGAPFSEHEHEAMMQQPAPEGTAPGTVLEEVQRGYRLGDRVLRHSKVVVAA